MRKYVLFRVIRAVLTILCVWTLIFTLTRITGDPVEWMLGDGAPEAAKARLRDDLGLNDPFGEQYYRSLAGLFTGDAGNSYHFRRPVSVLFAERFRATLMLGAIVFVLTVIIGILLGVLAAVKHKSAFDRAIMSFSVAGYTIPNFVFGILLIFVFSLNLRLLPSGSIGTPAHFVLPTIAMAVGPIANVARLTRSSLLDVISQEYLEYARAKGVREMNIILKHALRNALIPVITILGAQMSTLIGGSVVVETVFAWPGIGTLIVSAVRHRDFPVVQYGVLLIAISVTLVNLLVDLSYGILDPRVRDSY